MTVDVFKPFVTGIIDMASMMLGVEVEVGEESEDIPEPIVSGLINLDGEDARGQVAMSFPKETAVKMVAAMLGFEEDEVDEEALSDGTGEMVNIVAGYAKGKLSETQYKFQLSLPTIVGGPAHNVKLFRGKKTQQARMKTELGDFGLTVWMALENNDET